MNVTSYVPLSEKASVRQGKRKIFNNQWALVIDKWSLIIDHFAMIIGG